MTSDRVLWRSLEAKAHPEQARERAAGSDVVKQSIDAPGLTRLRRRQFLTLSGAIYLCLIALLPSMLVRQFNVPFYFGGTALLIVVGVALDTVAQMETHLISRNYEGFMKRGRLRGRKG